VIASSSGGCTIGAKRLRRRTHAIASRQLVKYRVWKMAPAVPMRCTSAKSPTAVSTKARATAASGGMPSTVGSIDRSRTGHLLGSDTGGGAGAVTRSS
jgi:hypothetical protein